MTDIRFYHLTKTKLDRALFQLLHKIHQTGKRSMILTDQEDQVKAIDQALWNLGGEAFLPHGTEADGRPLDQPVWISTKDENVNKADIILLCDRMQTEHLDQYDVVCEMFDGNDEEAVQHARQKWVTYKKDDHELSYWQQTAKGSWEKKAV